MPYLLQRRTWHPTREFQSHQVRTLIFKNTVDRSITAIPFALILEKFVSEAIKRNYSMLWKRFFSESAKWDKRAKQAKDAVR